MKCIISVLVENKAGVLNKVSGLFSARAYNIHSLTVGETQDPKISRMTISVSGDEQILNQIVRQLNRVIDVIKVVDLTGLDCITTEHMLMKVRCTESTFSAIKQYIDIFRAVVRDVNTRTIIIEITGDEQKLDSFVKLLTRFGILEVVRSGIIAIAKKYEVKHT